MLVGAFVCQLLLLMLNAQSCISSFNNNGITFGTCVGVGILMVLTIIPLAFITGIVLL